MQIDKNFTGGNIEVEKIEGDVVLLEREMRDSTGDWFYWAFRVKGAAGRTLTFRFDHLARVAYWGAAVSHDLKRWSWTGNRIATKTWEGFSYTFGADENEVYFAHNMLYTPDRFFAFAHENGLAVQTLCVSERGRNVPFVQFGDGENVILLTARHHACENTGSYVLEGVLTELLHTPLPNHRVVCVPFVDYDGVVDGDQGKNRAPYDHNRDYDKNQPALYASCGAIRRFIDKNAVAYAFDFHSPWHASGQNDYVYIVQKSRVSADNLKTFGRILTTQITPDSLPYDTVHDFPAEFEWNKENTPSFAPYASENPANRLAFSFETPYFNNDVDPITVEKMLALGTCFVRALRLYDRQVCTAKLSFVGDILCYPDVTEKSGKRYDPLFKDVERDLKNCDYLVGNLETPIAGEALGYTNERFCFNSPEEFLAALKNAGFHLLSLANNHCMDRGEEGIKNTLENCKKYGFDTVGLYDSAKARDKIFVKEINGLKVAFVNYTYGTNAFAHRRFLEKDSWYKVNLFQPEETLPGSIHLLNSAEQIENEVQALYFGDGTAYETYVKPYLDRLERDIKEAKKQADLVVMLAHSGGQRNREPEAYTKMLMQKIKAFGADVIVGLHPHVIQSCDRTDGYLTVYCLGNFVASESSFMHDTDLDQSLSTLLNLYVTKDETGRIRLRAGFKIVKLVTENGLPCVKNLYELYRQTGDESYRTLSVSYAKFFAGSEKDLPFADEYYLDLNPDEDVTPPSYK